MMIVILLFVSAILKEGLAQFPPHKDFQQVGAFVHKNDTYKMLKPAEHIVRDHFKDTMLRSKPTNMPSKRVFMDHNGFRHYWSGYETKLENMRKSNLDAFLTGSGISATSVNDGVNENDVNNLNPKDYYQNAESGDTDDSSALARKSFMIRKPKKTLYNSSERIVKNVSTVRTGGKTRTLARTTFYCPFFGVITTEAFID